MSARNGRCIPCENEHEQGEITEAQIRDGYERHSLGCYAGFMCDEHWSESGYRDEPASAFDPMDAGESYGEEDY